MVVDPHAPPGGRTPFATWWSNALRHMVVDPHAPPGDRTPFATWWSNALRHLVVEPLVPPGGRTPRNESSLSVLAHGELLDGLGDGSAVELGGDRDGVLGLLHKTILSF